MTKDQVEGRTTQAKGDIKEAAGKLVGNQKRQGEGLVDQAKGKTQAGYGDAKEQVKKGIDRI
ncbi:MAG: CsbD family protein [Caulobacter sp.]|nr:CsbD family protein [Vitreoscilla sp.]